MKPRYTRPDDNHNSIVRDLKTIPGLDVIDLHDLGIADVPDLLLGYGGVNYLVEIKNENGRLSPGQVEFHRDWPGQKSVARTWDDVLKIIGLMR